MHEMVGLSETVVFFQLALIGGETARSVDVLCNC